MINLKGDQIVLHRYFLLIIVSIVFVFGGAIGIFITVKDSFSWQKQTFSCQAKLHNDNMSSHLADK